MIRGQKFEVDLGSDSEYDSQRRSAPLPASFVRDVLERQPAAPKPPSAPSLKSKGGFPEHMKRNVASRFQQQKAVPTKPSSPGVSTAATDVVKGDAVPAVEISGDHASGKVKSWDEEEKERIDQENREKIAAMSPDEIEEERRELMNNLNPALLQRLLSRANVDSGSEEVDLSSAAGLGKPSAEAPKPKPKSNKTVKFEEPTVEETQYEEPEPEPENIEDETSAESLPHDTVHFPRAPQPPSLDPASDTFLEDLHQKYFPSLPSEPDKLEWMQSSSGPDSYNPSATAFNAKDLRFNFRGELIPPRTAHEIPVTKGLHHHGDAPEAAGYTIPELAHLSRSSYAAQRCIAFQTLGRILYRLGMGGFGNAGEPGAEAEGPQDTFGELARGLWHEVTRLKVIEILVDESEGRGVDGGKHMSAKAYATDAVWLWQKGGGRKWKAA